MSVLSQIDTHLLFGGVGLISNLLLVFFFFFFFF